MATCWQLLSLCLESTGCSAVPSQPNAWEEREGREVRWGRKRCSRKEVSVGWGWGCTSVGGVELLKQDYARFLRYSFKVLLCKRATIGQHWGGPSTHIETWPLCGRGAQWTVLSYKSGITTATANCNFHKLHLSFWVSTFSETVCDLMSSTHLDITGHTHSHLRAVVSDQFTFGCYWRWEDARVPGKKTVDSGSRTRDLVATRQQC